ncbi:MAG: hypothetical protein HRK26_05570 [Rickettsiaceae bacterium H1]|nr:hypothetical protein [Rickettsiaceae bacterium H1]
MLYYTRKINELRKKSHGLTGDLCKKTGCLIRDVTNAEKDVLRLKENYLIQALNVLRAGKILLEISECDLKFHNQLDELAKKILEYENQRWKLSQCLKVLQEVNEKLLNILKEAGIGTKFKEEEENLLSVAKNYSGFEDEHPDVMTILPIQDSKNSYYAQFSKKICILMDEQKEQYENLEKQGWFRILPEYKQKLVREYKEKITDGNHLIPTQIRDIPGVRNAYTTTIVTCDKEGNVQRELYKFTHSGTIAGFSMDDEQNKAMDAENLEQLRQNISGDLHFLALNTKNSLERDDSRCVKQTENAIKEYNESINQLERKKDDDLMMKVGEAMIGNPDGEQNFLKEINKKSREWHGTIKFSNTPTNVFRIFSQGKYNEMEKLLDSISDKISSSNSRMREVTHYLKVGDKGNFKKAQKELLELNYVNNDERLFLQSSLELKRLIKRYSGFFGLIRTLLAGRNNLQLRIISEFVRLQYQLQKLKEDKTGSKVISLGGINCDNIHIACKSGKDRTGFIGFIIALEIIKHDSGKNEGEIAEALSKAGHVQCLAGISGGTPGCVGIKKLFFSIPKNFGEKVENRLQLKTARFNCVIPRPSVFMRPIFKEINSCKPGKNLMKNPVLSEQDEVLTDCTGFKDGSAVPPSYSEIDKLIARNLGKVKKGKTGSKSKNIKFKPYEGNSVGSEDKGYVSEQDAAEIKVGSVKKVGCLKKGIRADL